MSFALELINISKTFGEFKANDSINLSIENNEVHALLGENGAGKSTLMNLIYGIHKPDDGGEIKLFGQKLTIKSPQHAMQEGIGMVHQHFMLIPTFTLLQNIILGIEPNNTFGVIDYELAKKEIQTICKLYNFDLDLDQLVENVSVGIQQKVEIIKTLYRKSKILIFDEPTAVLTPQEIIDFYRMIRTLKDEGKTIIIITHKLHEIKEIADRCSIIRKGKFIETVTVKDTSEEELASKMVGHAVKLKVDKNPAIVGNKQLEIRNLVAKNNKKKITLNNLCLELNNGEILGLAGIDGNGQSELVEALAGVRNIESGEILKNGINLANLNPKTIHQNKVAIVPEDRKASGLVIDFSIKENMAIKNISKPPFSHYGHIITTEINKFAEQLMERFDIRPRNINIEAKNLSGGNQQKVILAREIADNPDVLVAFQPTRGLDVGAIEYIHRELIKLRDQGKAVLLISYELDEIINLSDRIAIIYEGQVVKTLTQTEINSTQNIKESIGLYMAGGKS